MDFTLMENRLVVAMLSAVVGTILTLFTQRILNKRGLFTYFVSHNQVAVSGDDAIFGTVRVTWNNNSVANLYSSTIELRNESLKDYEDVNVRVFSGDTILLTERTEILGTTRSLKWSEAFSRTLMVPSGGNPTDLQKNLHASDREYLIPTMNRSQVVRLTFLNEATIGKPPFIGLDVLHTGAKVKYRVSLNEFWGVPQPSAALVGSISGFLFTGIVIVLVDNVWVAAITSFFYGIMVLVPGALLIKLWRNLRDLIGG